MDAPRDRNFVLFNKADEHYIFVFDDDHRHDVLCLLGRWAADEQLSLTWYDAAVLSQRIRNMVKSAR